jgi:predicted phage terminase large subunit-like protein
VVCGLNRAGILVVVEVVRFRGDSLQIIEEMFRLQRIYEPEIFWLEEENIARSIGPVLDQAMIQNNVYINIKTMVPSKDKMQRARGIQARMRAGGVRFDTSKDWYPSFFQELVTFPRGKFMDQVDAFSWVGLGLNQVMPTYTSPEISAWEYDDEYGDTFEELMNGRSEITGY